MEGEGQGRRDGQKQPPECLGCVQLKVKCKVSVNVSEVILSVSPY